MASLISSIENKIVEISISLPGELVRYIDERVDNRNQLIESLLSAWQKKQHQQAMLSACLVLEQTSIEEEEWQQAAITDWKVSI
jgi:metal-responsive CopG/Arc/MetJ family transcriptional regulator